MSLFPYSGYFFLFGWLGFLLLFCFETGFHAAKAVLVLLHFPRACTTTWYYSEFSESKPFLSLSQRQGQLVPRV